MSNPPSEALSAATPAREAAPCAAVRIALPKGERANGVLKLWNCSVLVNEMACVLLPAKGCISAFPTTTAAAANRDGGTARAKTARGRES
ncbi:MAG: hypothetical protein AMJ67_09680 [Betaproteobacteria bacterium SG8_41]|nr:MAG: hypothetical protein AMJ67_09680 [Betaproteobacteria bacterium SG8_41]